MLTWNFLNGSHLHTFTGANFLVLIFIFYLSSRRFVFLSSFSSSTYSMLSKYSSMVYLEFLVISSSKKIYPRWCSYTHMQIKFTNIALTLIWPYSKKSQTLLKANVKLNIVLDFVYYKRGWDPLSHSQVKSL